MSTQRRPLTGPLIILLALSAFSFGAMISIARADHYHANCVGHGFVHGDNTYDGSFFARVEGCGTVTKCCGLWARELAVQLDHLRAEGTLKDRHLEAAVRPDRRRRRSPAGPEPAATTPPQRRALTAAARRRAARRLSQRRRRRLLRGVTHFSLDAERRLVQQRALMLEAPDFELALTATGCEFSWAERQGSLAVAVTATSAEGAPAGQLGRSLRFGRGWLTITCQLRDPTDIELAAQARRLVAQLAAA